MRAADLILVMMGCTNRRRPLKLAEERHGVDGWMSSTSPNPLAASQCCEGSQTITTNFSSSRGHAQASQRISNGSGARVPGLQMSVIHDALTNGRVVNAAQRRSCGVQASCAELELIWWQFAVLVSVTRETSIRLMLKIDGGR
jgi:hypothetical protein